MPYHPQATPAYRVHREMNSLWHHFCCSNHREWVKYLKEVIFYYTISDNLHMTTVETHLNITEPIPILRSLRLFEEKLRDEKWDQRVYMMSLGKQEAVAQKRAKGNEITTSKRMFSPRI